LVIAVYGGVLTVFLWRGLVNKTRPSLFIALSSSSGWFALASWHLGIWSPYETFPWVRLSACALGVTLLASVAAMDKRRGARPTLEPPTDESPDA
jgi:hypothetical protein